MSTDFCSVTEASGDDVAAEQVERLARRYYWAGGYCAGGDVLEVACGTGQGVGYLASLARSVTAGDYSAALLQIARSHYGSRFQFARLDAHALPFANDSFDVVVIFEALYYLSTVGRFFQECRRVLRPGGVLLIASANKDLFDFNPSAHSHRYLGVVELYEELGAHGFEVRCFGDTPLDSVSRRQRVLRPAKMIASRLGFIPASTAGKKLLKRFFFGGLVPMPAEISAATAPRVEPMALEPHRVDYGNKVIYCAAKVV